MQDQMTIQKALFVETGTYNDMVVRPYEATADYQLVNMFNEATQNGMSVSPGTVSDVAGLFLRPTTEYQNFAQIDNGWAEPRLRFIMDVLIPSPLGTPVRRIVQGYTSHVGVSHGGHVDPNMRLYFNNMLTLRQTQTETPYGSSIRTMVAEANHLIKGSHEMSFAGAPVHTWSMRPEDVFTTMGRSILGGMDDITDLRTTFAEFPVKKSRRANGSAPHYMSQVINGYRKTFDQGAYENAVDLDDAMSSARGFVREDSVTMDAFLHNLITHTTSFGAHGFVTYGEMCSLAPDLDQLAVIIPAKQHMPQSPAGGFAENHQAGQTEYWTSTSNETIWASILAQSVPSLMMDLMLTRIGFMTTNQTLDGSYEVRVMDAHSFADGVDITPYINHFVERLKTEVLRGLSSNNHLDFSLTMLVDVVGETRINISIAGGPTIEFASPSFCDSIYTPVLTDSSDRIEQVASDIQSLVDNVGVNHVHSYDTDFTPTGGNFNGSTI